MSRFPSAGSGQANRLSMTSYLFLNEKSGKNLFAEGMMQIGAAGEDPFVEEDHFIRFQEL
jgi:hypothetical protein